MKRRGLVGGGLLINSKEEATEKDWNSSSIIKLRYGRPNGETHDDDDVCVSCRCG